MILLGEGDLLLTEGTAPHDSCPRRGSMPASQVLTVLAFVTLTAVGSCQLSSDLEAPVIESLLVLRGLMTIETVDAFPCVSAEFELMNNSGCLLRVTGSALASGADEIRARLRQVRGWASLVEQDSRNDHPGSDDHCDEDCSKGRSARSFLPARRSASSLQR
jgi:hypothetical protein